MKTIKFRAWDKRIKSMQLPEEFRHAICLHFGNNGYVEIGNGGEVIFQQYTGIIDKNGKEIFEGDILKYWNTIGKLKINRVGFVRFDRGTFEVGFHNGYGGEWDGINTSMEIIGNIYENPELLK